MKYITATHQLKWWFIGWLMIVSACAGKPLEISYYSLAPLSSLNSPSQAVTTLPDLQIGVGPITLPEALKRSQIVTRSGEYRYSYAESHRWTGDMEHEISRALAENVSVLLGTERVAVFPWGRVLSPDYRIVLDIQEFDGVRGGDASLKVRWAVSDGKGRNLLAVKKSLVKHPTGGDTYEALVRAQSETLALLSREICGEIARLAALQGTDDKKLQ